MLRLRRLRAGHPGNRLRRPDPRDRALDAIAIGKASITAAANAIEGKGQTKINFPYNLCDVQTQALNKRLLAEVSA